MAATSASAPKKAPAQKPKSTNRASNAVAPIAVQPAEAVQAMAKTNRAFLARHGIMRSTRSSFDLPFSFGKSKTYYEAASNAPSIEYAPDYGPNAANGEIPTIIRRSRWTYANDAFYRNLCNNYANNLVGYGINPRIRDKRLRKLWRKWIKECDARGVQNIHAMAHSAVVSRARDGGSFGRFRPRRKEDMKSGVPVQIQMLEYDYVPFDKNEILSDGNIIISGIEKDQIDRVRAFWMYDYHPRDLIRLGSGGLPRRVPAADVLHVYDPDRFESMRGTPLGSPVLNKSEGMKTYDEAELEKHKGNSMHGGFITPPLGEDGKATLGVDGVDGDGIEFAGMSPGTWTITPPGYEIEFANPPVVDQNYPLFRREGMSEVSVAFGLSVEHATLNFEKLNDRQWRANNLEVTRGLEHTQNNIIIPRFYQPVWERFVSEAYLADVWQPEAGKTVDDYYDVEWLCPARGHIHPVQEVAALKEALRCGFISRKRVAAAFGDDAEDIDEDNATDQLRSQSLGLKYDVYGAHDGLDFSKILDASMIQDALDDLDDNDASDAGSIISSG